jgi:cytochrome c-type biogenesis protein CcmF
MFIEVGHFAVVLAFALSIVASTIPLWGAHKADARLMALAVPAVRGQFILIAVGFAALVAAFIDNDFSVLYVAENSNTALPFAYRIAAVWGAHEGSLLLWVLILAGWALAVSIFSQSLPVVMKTRVLALLSWVTLGFLSFLLFTSNPFERLIPAALEGRDLNPLLQDPALVIHPPMLYMGYVGFSVAWAFAVAALLGGTLDSTWARWSRPWTTVAWLFLTIGISLGSWWAYYELGWGGWWFWDPVENASFMPWLMGTALIHSLAVTEKRATFKNWTVLLAIFTFSLSLLGTFLVRSGVLVSVHAFATDPERGAWILAMMTIFVSVGLFLYAWRAPYITSVGKFNWLSRESLLLVNNVLLVVAAITVLTGTLYPIALDWLKVGKISVGPPYFNATFVPLMLPLMLAMGFGVASRWKRDSRQLLNRLAVACAVAAALGLLFNLLVVDNNSVLIAVSVFLAFWVLVTAAREPVQRIRSKGSVAAGIKSLPLHLHGMVVAHIGLAITALGIAVTSADSAMADEVIKRGNSATVGGYEFQFKNIEEVAGPNYDATRASIKVSQGREHVAWLYPEKRIYRVQTSPMTEAGIDAGFTRDVYVSLGEPVGNDSWSFRMQVKPLVRWIWLGTIFMAIGGLLAVCDPRYRRKAKRKVA